MRHCVHVADWPAGAFLLRVILILLVFSLLVSLLDAMVRPLLVVAAVWLLSRTFPFYGHIGQFWNGYWAVSRESRAMGQDLNPGYHLMVMVIGTSTSVEYLLRLVYESLVGRLTQATAPVRPPKTSTRRSSRRTTSISFASRRGTNTTSGPS
ncbi:MAG: hypothetical protein NVS2B4_06250 [Ramlibacter sp.]